MGDDRKETGKRCVVVTGFGPFGEHKINASWVAVQELVNLGLDVDAELVTEELPVVYEYIQQRVPELWKQYSPHLMVHVGVSGIAEKVTLEQQAFNVNYVKQDVEQCLPREGVCVRGGEDCVKSRLDMMQVCQAVNDHVCTAQAEVSNDPGRYVCDFTYYTSLNEDRKRAAFIHVPVLNKPYSARQLAEAMKQAIENMVKQLQEQ